MVPIIVFCILLGLVPLVGYLSHHLARALNDDWQESAVDWAGTAGATPEMIGALETLPPLPVPSLHPAVSWLAGWLVAALSAAWVWQHPDDLLGAAFAIALGWGLLLAILVDIRIQLLPDIVIWPLAALGVAASLVGLSVNPHTALMGAVVGGGALWLLTNLFKLLRGQEGLGLGDVKLVIVAGLWLGWMALPWMLMAASVGAILLHLLLYRGDMQRRLAFGPALAIALLAVRLIQP